MSVRLLDKGVERKKRVLASAENSVRRSAKDHAEKRNGKQDREQLNDETVRLRSLIRQKDEEISRLNDQNLHFLNSAAHDLRNPLGVIQMYCEFMLTEPEENLNEAIREFISVITGTGIQMQGIINNMLDYSKMESGSIGLELMPVEMDHLISKSLLVSAKKADTHNITLINDAEETGMVLNIDGYRIEQAITNLIGNAIKFSKPASRVWIGSQMADNGFYITVKDEGQGIPESEHDKLFKPFSKTRVLPLNGDARTGLGLALVKTIVEKHNGSVGFESEEGKGSEFYFWLPV
ncbi:MAG: sensor histidine kinase [Cyclonatronaceae bacterium]